MKLTFYVSLKINRINSHLQNRPFQKKNIAKRFFGQGACHLVRRKRKKKEKKKKKRREKKEKRKKEEEEKKKNRLTFWGAPQGRKFKGEKKNRIPEKERNNICVFTLI